jgi:UDP-N-acetylmuramoylalanine--D-glutamate ligase
MTSKDYFKGKRIAVVGLDAHGEMVEDIKFMIKAGALVSVYDLKSEARLKSHLVFLRTIGLANYVCGSIPEDDLLDMDLIILSHEYPRESLFLKVSREKGIPIEYPETLFFKLAPPVTLVGVIGGCGKATVISMLAPMLKEVCSSLDGQGFFVIDPESGDGIISLLKKVKNGDIVLMRITDMMMHELHSIRISPHVAVFTTIPPEGSYTNSPFEILDFQTYNNFVIGNDEIIDTTHKLRVQPKSKMLRTKASLIPAEWKFNGRGVHDRDNAALALQAGKLFKVTDEIASKILGNWKSLKGRIELVKKIKDVEYYNDSASVSSSSTARAIETLSSGRNLVLVFGGAKTENDYQSLYSILPDHVHTVVLLPGSGTIHERSIIQKLDHISVCSAPSIEEATHLAMEHAKKGDRVIFSPGFAAVGFEGSWKGRGERFVRAVKSL